MADRYRGYLELLDAADDYAEFYVYDEDNVPCHYTGRARPFVEAHCAEGQAFWFVGEKIESIVVPLPPSREAYDTPDDLRKRSDAF